MHISTNTPNGTPIFSCTKAEANAILEFASKDETRRHINSVCIDWRHGAAVATDGHRLAKANGMAQFDRDPTLIDRASLARAAKLAPAKSGLVVVEPEGRIRVFDLGKIDPRLYCPGDQESDEKFTIAEFNAADRSGEQFPPYDQVIPNLLEFKIKDRKHGMPPAKVREATHVWGMSAEYLAALSLVTKATGDKGVEIYPPAEELDPVRIHATGWVVVIMPMRI